MLPSQIVVVHHVTDHLGQFALLMEVQASWLLLGLLLAERKHTTESRKKNDFEAQG